MSVDHNEAMRRAQQRATDRAHAEQANPPQSLIDAYAHRFFLEYVQPRPLSAQMNLRMSPSLVTPSQAG